MTELTYPYAAPRRLSPGPAVTELSTMIVRGLRLSLRNVDGLITALALPVMLMLMFVYLFGGAIQTGTPTSTTSCPGCCWSASASGPAPPR